ncbi:RHS repeat protein, partial [Ralstonia pseudosolanacearum]
TGADGNVWRAENNGEWWGAGDSPDAACRSATAGFKARYPWDTREYLYLENKQINAPGTAGCIGRFSNGVLGIIGTTVRIGQCAAGYLTQPDGSCAPKKPEVKTCAVGHPVFPNTGVKVLMERDDAGSADLPLSRTYRSSVLFGLVTGVGQWLFNWQRELDAPIGTADNTSAPITAMRENGTSRVFRKSGSTWTTFGSRDTVAGLSDGAGTLTGWQYTVAETGAVETYGTNGKLLSVRERNGRTTTLTYSPSHQLMQVTAPTGRKLTFAYDLQGRIISVTAPDGAITQYAYNANGMLTAVTWPSNVTRQYVYEDARFPTALTGVIDEAGVRYATYAYDDQGRAITSELTGGTDRYQFQYQVNGQTTVLPPNGGSSVYSFLTQNGVLLPTSVSAPCPLCGKTAKSTEYNTNNNVTREVDYNDAATTYAYDALGRETQRIVNAGTSNTKTTTTEWHPAWYLPTRVASPGKLETFVYDDKGNLTAHTSVATGDANGSASFAAAPASEADRINWTYDGNGLVLSATEYIGNRMTDTWTFTYDGQGNLLTLTNPKGKTGRITQYDAAGRVLAAVDVNGITLNFAYNARGWLTDYEFDGQHIRYEYDAIGQRTGVIGPQNLVTRYVYDAAHRLTEILDNITLPESSAQTNTASPFGTAPGKQATGRPAVPQAFREAVVHAWNSALKWIKRQLSAIIQSAHAQVGPAPAPGPGGGGLVNDYRPSPPTPNGSQTVNQSPYPEDVLDPNAGSRIRPDLKLEVVKTLIGVQQACNSAVQQITQVF